MPRAGGGTKLSAIGSICVSPAHPIAPPSCPPNVPEFLIAWFAINAIGAVMQTVHTPYGIRELEHLIAHGGAKAAIALAQTKDRSPAGEIAF